MKRFVKVSLVVLFIGFIGFSMWDLSQKINIKKEVSERLASFPKRPLYRLGSMMYQQESLSNNLPTVIVYFNSECDCCQREVKSIEDNITSFDPTNILFISSKTISVIRHFKDQFDFSAHLHVKFLKINEDVVYPTFGSISVPHLLIYGTNGVLKKEYKGEIKVATIIKHISS